MTAVYFAVTSLIFHLHLFNRPSTATVKLQYS